MKLLTQLGLVAMVAWLAHSIGFDSGLEASDAYVELRRDELLLREAQYLEDIKRAAEYSLPTREECVPVMEGEEDIDVYEFCVSLVNQRNADYQDAMQDGRSQYD